ncbi:MAG TPA: protein arginine kinase [Chitinispirillaceae bacterium]|nr:protein arginine kinase [Chitinispirillaceae bacterium]
MAKSFLEIDLLPAWFNNSGPDSDVVISSRIRLARNLVHRPFPYHASAAERKLVYSEVTDVLQNEAKLPDFEILDFNSLEKLQQQFFVEERVVSPDLMNFEGQRGVACDPTRRVNIMINEEDHLRIQGIDSGYQPEQLWDTLNKIDDVLGCKLRFAFDLRRGFLTCCPTNSGTGLRISFLMHLPGLVLTKAIDAVLQGASQMGISTRGFFGEHSEVVGNFFQLSNQATMGAHEDEFLSATQKIICEVIKHEREARSKLLNEAALELTDKVYRAYGILLHARTLSVAECLNLTSALRLGINTGLFDVITIEELNRITLLSMPAHLQIFRKKDLNDTEISVARADLVRELLTKRKRKKSSPRSEQ